MATLVELLISAELNPDVLPEEGKYLAQDYFDMTVYLYDADPHLQADGELYEAIGVLDTFIFKDSHFISLEQLASDWETPLSIEEYTAAWNAAHNVNVKEEENVMCEDVEFPVKMEYIGEGDGSFVVLFTDYSEGEVIFSQNGFRPVGDWDNTWTPCNVSTAWKPYVEATQSPSAALPDVPVTLTAQDIVLRLEELKTGIKAMEAIKETLVKEYEELRDTLLTLI